MRDPGIVIIRAVHRVIGSPFSAKDEADREESNAAKKAQNALLIDAAYAHACMSHVPVDEVCASLSNGMCPPVAMFEHPSSPVDVVKPPHSRVIMEFRAFV